MGHYDCPVHGCPAGGNTVSELCGHIAKKHQVNVFPAAPHLRGGDVETFNEIVRDAVDQP